MTTLLNIKASRMPRNMLAASYRRNATGFSLIEVLLAIFILGVGVISIAALFPAGIAQQRASADEIIGPTVANNALSLLRTKLRPDDFGNFEQFGVSAPRYTIAGDFTWIRPGFIFADDGSTPNLNESGAIDVFSAGADVVASEFFPAPFGGSYPGSAPALEGIPFNRGLYGSAPRILISQTERYYPAVTQNGTGDVARPQYVWDCMFRKFQGKVLVAIFVYRVTQPGGGNAPYVVSANPSDNSVPPLPIALDLTSGTIQSNNCANGPWNPGGPDRNMLTDDDTGTPNQKNAIVTGMPGGVPYNPDDQSLSWQEPRQWILDQNNNIHRVLGVSRDDPADPQSVELVRAAPGMPDLDVSVTRTGAFFIDPANGDCVSDIWYLPVSINDANGEQLTLTPVYVTVKEL